LPGRFMPEGKPLAGFATKSVEGVEGDVTAELAVVDGLIETTAGAVEGVAVAGEPSALGGGPHFWLTQPPVW